MKDEKKMVKDFLNIYRNTLDIAMDSLKLKREAEDSVGYKNTSDSVGKFIYYWTTYMTMMHNILYYFIYQINIEYKDDIEELESRVKENTIANPLFNANFRLFNIIYDEYTDKMDGAIIVRCLDKSEIRDINNPSAIVDTMNLVYNIEYNDYNKYIAYSLEVCMDHGEYIKNPTAINIGTLDLKANTKDELLSIIRSSYTATDFLTLAIVNMVRVMDFQDVNVSTLTSASDVDVYYNDLLHHIDIVRDNSDTFSMDIRQKTYDGEIAIDILDKCLIRYAGLFMTKNFSAYKIALDMVKMIKKYNEDEENNNVDQSVQIAKKFFSIDKDVLDVAEGILSLIDNIATEPESSSKRSIRSFIKIYTNLLEEIQNIILLYILILNVEKYTTINNIKDILLDISKNESLGMISPIFSVCKMLSLSKYEDHIEVLNNNTIKIAAMDNHNLDDHTINIERIYTYDHDNKTIELDYRASIDGEIGQSLTKKVSNIDLFAETDDDLRSILMGFVAFIKCTLPLFANTFVELYELEGRDEEKVSILDYKTESKDFINYLIDSEMDKEALAELAAIKCEDSDIDTLKVFIPFACTKMQDTYYEYLTARRNKKADITPSENANSAESSSNSIAYNKDPIPGSKDVYNPDKPIATVEDNKTTPILKVSPGMKDFIEDLKKATIDSLDKINTPTNIKSLLFGNTNSNITDAPTNSDDVVKIDKSNNPVEQLDILSENMCNEFFLGTAKDWFSIKRALEIPHVNDISKSLEITTRGSFPTYKIPMILTDNLIKKLDEETEKTDAMTDNRVGRFFLNGDSLCVILFNKNKAKAVVGLSPDKDAIWRKYYPKTVSEEIMSVINKVKSQDPNTYDDYWFIVMNICGYYACSLSHIKLNTNMPIIVYPRLMKYIYRIISLALKKKVMHSYKDSKKKKTKKSSSNNTKMLRINYLHKEESVDDLAKVFNREYDINSIKKKSAVLLKNIYKYYSDMQTRIESGEPLPKNRGRIEYYLRLTGEDKKYNTKYRDLVITNKGYMYPAKTTNALSEYRDAALEIYDKNHVYLYIEDTDIDDDNYLLKAISNTLKYVEYTKENEGEFNVFGERDD